MPPVSSYFPNPIKPSAPAAVNYSAPVSPSYPPPAAPAQNTPLTPAANPFAGFVPKPCPVTGKGKSTPLDDGNYKAECPGFIAVARHQETDVWCWAACIQMVDLYRGQSVTQTSIVERVHGRAPGDDTAAPEVRGALEWEVMVAMCPVETQRFRDNEIQLVVNKLARSLPNNHLGRGQNNVKLDASKFVDIGTLLAGFNTRDVVESISHGIPVLVSLTHKSDPNQAHMYVIYSVNYKPALVDATSGLAIGSQYINGPKNQQAPSVEPSYTVSEISVVNPWTAKTEVMTSADYDGRVAYTLSEISVKKSLADLSSGIR